MMRGKLLLTCLMLMAMPPGVCNGNNSGTIGEPLVASVETAANEHQRGAAYATAPEKDNRTESGTAAIYGKHVVTIDIPEETPVADSNGQIPGADGISSVDRKTVLFGRFYQEASADELRPIQWIVLGEKDGYTLLMTKQIIASKGWVNEGRNGVTWAQTDLRHWLDNEFFNTAFSFVEQKNMALFNAVQHQNPRYDTPAGEGTVDRVSILSYQELIHYMPTNLERKTKPTEYAIKQGCYLNPDGDSAWWLRSPGPNAAVPEHLASWGNLGARTHYVDDSSIGVRPVIWVNSDYLATVR